MNKYLSILIMGMTLLSCGSKDKGAPSSVDNTIRLENEQELRDAIAASTVNCMESSCPDNVGKLLFWKKNSSDDSYEFGVCSGTLIDSTTLITNRHCIPTDLRTGDNCSNRLIIQFPQLYGKGIAAENIQCNYVDKVYDEVADQPDIAILKVSRSQYNRTAVKRKSNQMSSASQVYAYTMNPGKGRDAFSGYIYKKNCNISEQSILTGRMMPNSSDAVIYGHDCNVISGNSGSGVFNQDGDLIGVLHSRIDTTEVKSMFRNLGVKYQFYSYMGVFVNISCAEDYFRTGRGSCKNIRMETVDDLKGYISQEKRRSAFARNLNDEVMAYIGEGLRLELKKKPAYPSSYGAYLTMSTLEELETALSEMYENAAGYVEHEYVWATVK